MSVEEKVNMLVEQFRSGKETFKLHTSGSTGEPKEILLQRELMEKSARNSIAALGLTKDDNFLICISPDTVGGFMQLFRAYILGASFHCVDPSGSPFLTVHDDHTFTSTSLVPYQLSQILKDEVEINKLKRFQKILVGGAPVSESLRVELEKFEKPVFYHTYGMTETYSHIALKQLNNPPQQHFTAVPGIKVCRTPEEQLIIHGFTSEDIITNDLSIVYDATTFDIVGRYDDVINSGGVKIHTSKVEDKIVTSGILSGRNFFIGKKESEEFGSVVILAIEGEVDEEEEVKTELKKILDRYEVPKEIIFIEKFLYTKSLKVDKVRTLGAQAIN